jgi:hypothetical protein
MSRMGRARLVRVLLLACIGLLAGCALELGLASGVSVPVAPRANARATWSGELRASVMPGASTQLGNWLVDHLIVGGELAGRALAGRGAFMSAGGALGLGAASPRRTCYAQLEAGGPFGFSARLRGFYAGAALGYLWTLSPESALVSRNRGLRGVDFRPQLGPLLRYRVVSVDVLGDTRPRELSHDLVVGVSFRMQLISDFL